MVEMRNCTRFWWGTKKINSIYEGIIIIIIIIKYFFSLPLTPQHPVPTNGNYILADRNSMYKKYKLKRPKHILL
jgi:hypothetical protein